MNKRVVVTVIAILSLASIIGFSQNVPKRARPKGLITPLDDNLNCVYDNCLQVTLGTGFVGTVKPSSQPGFVRLYPENKEDRQFIKNRQYILVKEDQLIYL